MVVPFDEILQLTFSEIHYQMFTLFVLSLVPSINHHSDILFQFLIIYKLISKLLLKLSTVLRIIQIPYFDERKYFVVSEQIEIIVNLKIIR